MKRQLSDNAVGRSATKAKIEASPDDASLCNRCNTISWSTLALNAPHPLRRNLARDIADTHNDLKTSHCSGCRVLALIKPEILDGKRCRLVAFSIRSVFGRVGSRVKMGEADSTMIGIVTDDKTLTSCLDKGFMAVNDTNAGGTKFGPRKILPAVIDFAILQDWLNICSTTHKNTCQYQHIKQVEAMKVVDCVSLSVMKAPEQCDYIALSYVWGDSQSSQNLSELNGSALPQVVRDAISVTRALGYKYLWVDRYVRHLLLSKLFVLN